MSVKNEEICVQSTIENKHPSRLVATHKPARQVISRSKDNVRGLYSSEKNGRTVACESLLEHQACNIFEFCKEIITYKEQPVAFPYYLLGKWRSYTPDFQLTL